MLKARFCPGCSNGPRCKAARKGPSEAYFRYAAASARASQRRRWAFFSSLPGILPHDLAQTIAACAGLRNRIVHEYDEIDPAKIHEALQTAARDVPQYLTRIHGYVERASP